MDRLKELLVQKSITFAENKKASEFTSFHIGGECFTVYPKTEEELISAALICLECDVRYTVLGCCSNVLISDNGYNGALILTQYINGVEVNGNTVSAECGATLISVCKAALNNSLSGFEFAYGIPGSVGGAVFMNAGAYNGEMKDVIKSVRAYSVKDCKIIKFDNKECDFGYRHSLFADTNYIVLSASAELKAADKDEIRATMDDLLGRRKSKQPLNYPSAGSAFKRYPGRYTGQMIEQAGLKGYTVGGAQVSEKHAGFIINIGGATAQDVKELVGYIQKVIKEREGVDIEPEIRVIE